MSLRRRILVLAVAVAGLVLVAFAVPMVVLLQQAARENALEKATDVAHGVADYASTSSVSRVSLSAYVDRVNQRDDAFPVRVDLPDGSQLGDPLDGVDVAPPGRPGADPSADVDGDRDGDENGDGGGGTFADTSTAQVRTVEGGRLVTITVGSGGGTDVLVYVASSRVRDVVLQRLLVLAVAAVVVLALAALAAERVSRRLVRDLAAAAGTADALSAGDLGARAPEGGPAEVRRVSTALNRLAGRIEELLAIERETVADLSHRLRTPLTAVRLDVEALPDSPARVELESHLDLLQLTLTAVIHAARRSEREGVLPTCAADAIVRDRLEFWSPLMEDRGHQVQVDLATAPLTVRCADEDLAAALDALLENVVAHTPEGTPLQVSLQAEGDTVVIEVRDRGPGITQGVLPRGASDRGSTGLGLDIARSCAVSSGGRLQASRSGGWTVVRLELGRP